MKTKLKTWPQNWVEHIAETCFFYFEDKDISFVDSRILSSGASEDAKIYCIVLTFQKFDNIYDIYISHEESSFLINYYYKEYYKLTDNKGFNNNYIFVMDTILRGSDELGAFDYLDLGGQASRDYTISAYYISQSIESIINFHTNRDDNDDDGGEEEEEPIEPFSPSDVMEPELLSC